MAVARQEVTRWIEVLYNRRRRHSSLGYQPSVEFEHTKNEASTTTIEDHAA